MSDEPLPERIGDYVIERCLGVGGMAKVYEARHAVLETRHAIKVLDPSYRANPAARQRFLDEAKIQASQLDHPNIVKVVNIVATTEHAALVMELIDGPSLEKRVGHLQNKPDEIRSIMLAVLDAVGYAHDKGIIHRDLKPANVLLAKRGNQVVPKVTDFGIAKIAAGGSGKKSTHADARMGTLAYSSPEQLRSPKDVTPRSDVFSLGAMLYELATGQLAFPGDNDYDVMDAIIKGRYVPPEEHHAAIDPVIASVIRKALELAPANRFASCREMADALAASTSAAPSPRPDPVPTSREEEPSKRRLGLWLGVGAMVVVGGSVAAFAVAGRDGGEPVVTANARDADVCAGSAAICTSPPTAVCATPTTARSFSATGTCIAAKGGCSYEPIDQTCEHGCSNGVCTPPPVTTPPTTPTTAVDAGVEPPPVAPGNELPAATPGDELIGDYTCHVTCTNVGTQRCADSAYGCAIARDKKGTLRLKKSCCSFAWNLAISNITDDSILVKGDVCFGNGPCYGQGTLKRRSPTSFAGKILAKDGNDPVENVVRLVRNPPKK